MLHETQRIEIDLVKISKIHITTHSEKDKNGKG